MATVEEYQRRLQELSEEQFAEFNKHFGGGQLTREARVREYVSDPRHERRICQLLTLKTEADKSTEAQLQSADAASASARAARRSALWAGLGCIVALLAVIVAVIGLFL